MSTFRQESRTFLYVVLIKGTVDISAGDMDLAMILSSLLCSSFKNNKAKTQANAEHADSTTTQGGPGKVRKIWKIFRRIKQNIYKPFQACLSVSYFRHSHEEVTKTTVRRDLQYDVTVHRLLPPTDIPPGRISSRRLFRRNNPPAKKLIIPQIP